jgi:hypothetical protein
MTTRSIDVQRCTYASNGSFADALARLRKQDLDNKVATLLAEAAE